MSAFICANGLLFPLLFKAWLIVKAVFPRNRSVWHDCHHLPLSTHWALVPKFWSEVSHGEKAPTSPWFGDSARDLRWVGKEGKWDANIGNIMRWLARPDTW